MITPRWILQQTAHFVQGFIYSLLLSLIFGVPVWWFGAVVGIYVEAYQYLGPDSGDPRIADRLADWLFWTAGGVLTLLF